MQQISYPNGSPTTTHLSFGMLRRLAAWRPRHILRAMLPIAFAALLSAPSVQAEITTTGDVDPSDPSTWTSSTTAYIGNTADGSVTVDDGSTVSTGGSYLGYASGATGTLTLDGEGTTWSSGSLTVSNGGIGILNITKGATYNDGGQLQIGYNGGYGTINIDGDESSLNANGSFGMYNGLVTVTNGASLNTISADLRGTEGGTIIVDGPGSTWTNSGTEYIGAHGGVGAIQISNGGTVTNSSTVYLGYNAGNGTLTVDGAGTSFIASGSLMAGYSNGATGSVSITNGGYVSVGQTLYISPSQLSGSGFIDTPGIVSDIDLIFDASHGTTQSFAINGVTVNLSQSSSGVLGAGYLGSGNLTIADGVSVESSKGYLAYQEGSTGIATVTGPGSTWTNTGYLYVGYSGPSSIDILNGGSVTNTRGYIGYRDTSNSRVTVDGAGSTWTNTDRLYVGYSGSSSLNIFNGGSVSNTTGYIAYRDTSNSRVTIDGAGSTWTNTATLYVGSSGTASLSTSDGGAVTASSVSINSSSILTTDVGYGSSLTVGSEGTGTVTNSGTLRLVAGAGAASGTYTPMSYGTLSGNDAQALGGVWDSVNHTVTVSDAETALAGEAKTIDLFATQRVLFVDAATAQVVGASLMATPESTDLTFTANLMDSSDRSLLESSLDPGEDILAGWEFSAEGSGYAEGDPVYISMEIGSGYDLSDLAVWLFDGSVWSEFLASDLAYDDVYASFTVTDLCGYAVTGSASVPIPGAVWLLGSGLLGLVGIRRRKK